MAAGSGFGPGTPDRYDAILVDIDHTPQHSCTRATLPSTNLKGSGGSLIVSTREVSTPVVRRPPDQDYISVVEEVFASCEAHVVTFRTR